MKWIKTILFLSLILFLVFPLSVKAKEKVNLYFFYGEGCPHCAKEEVFLDKIEKKYDNLTIYRYEVWYSATNAKLLEKAAKLLNKELTGVPFTVIGDHAVVGYSEDFQTDTDIETLINYYSENEHQDKVGEMLGIVKKGDDIKNDNKDKDKETIKLPFLGEINPKTFSLPLITIVIGLLDGFNPCAMWVLLFLISMLINMKDKKRMWILGITFILTSAIVYYAFMAAWLNLTLFVGSLLWFRIIIASVAVIGGAWNLNGALKKKDDGCEVVGEKKRKKIFAKIKEFTSTKKFAIALLGIITLSITVNIVELFCSAGLPVIYSQILAMNNVSTLGHYGYLLLYILFFMLDDLIVYIIAMKTLTLKGISTKYGKISHLIGGIIMIIIGILLILKPEWLSFWAQ